MISEVTFSLTNAYLASKPRSDTACKKPAFLLLLVPSSHAVDPMLSELRFCIDTTELSAFQVVGQSIGKFIFAQLVEENR